MSCCVDKSSQYAQWMFRNSLKKRVPHATIPDGWDVGENKGSGLTICLDRQVEQQTWETSVCPWPGILYEQSWSTKYNQSTKASHVKKCPEEDSNMNASSSLQPLPKLAQHEFDIDPLIWY